MAKRSLILTSTAAGTGKKLQKTITDINPNIGAEALKGFTQKLNAMTTNTYVQTDCIDKYNVDTEQLPVDTRLTPTITFPENQPPTLLSGLGNLVKVTHTGDGNVYVRRNSGCTGIDFVMGWESEGSISFRLTQSQQMTAAAGTYVVGLTGTETYKPLEIEYTLT